MPQLPELTHTAPCWGSGYGPVCTATPYDCLFLGRGQKCTHSVHVLLNRMTWPQPKTVFSTASFKPSPRLIHFPSAKEVQHTVWAHTSRNTRSQGTCLHTGKKRLQKTGTAFLLHRTIEAKPEDSVAWLGIAQAWWDLYSSQNLSSLSSSSPSLTCRSGIPEFRA